MVAKVKKIVKKNVRKKATKVNVANKVNSIVITVGQAKILQAFALKNNKVFKFLDNKVNKV